MELQVIKQQAPIIEFNYKELEITLTELLVKYENLIITEETEKEGKDIRAELNKLSKKLDDFRKDVKSEVSKPLTDFEEQMKLLVAKINLINEPISKQLKELDDKRKEQKAEEINVIITDIIEQFELEPHYASKLDISAKYLNKSETMAKITEDLNERAKLLKQNQESHRLHVDIIHTTVSIYNNKLKSKIDAQPFIMLLESHSFPINEVVQKIHELGKQKIEEQLELEQLEMQQAINNIALDDDKALEDYLKRSKVMELTPEAQEGPILSATLTFYGTKMQMQALKSIMEKIGIKYEKVNK